MKKETDAIEFLEKHLAMKILLTDEEITKLPGYANTTNGAEPLTSDWRLRPRTIAQAQLKKVVDYMGANGGLHINEFNNKHFEMDWNVWQALKKEAGL